MRAQSLDPCSCYLTWKSRWTKPQAVIRESWTNLMGACCSFLGICSVLMNTSREVGTILSYRIFCFLIPRQRKTNTRNSFKRHCEILKTQNFKRSMPDTLFSTASLSRHSHRNWRCPRDVSAFTPHQKQRENRRQSDWAARKRTSF